MTIYKTCYFLFTSYDNTTIKTKIKVSVRRTTFSCAVDFVRYPRYISIFVAFYCWCCFPLFPYSFNATNMNLSMSGLHWCSSPLLSSRKWSSRPKNIPHFNEDFKVLSDLGWTLGFKEFYVSTNNPHVNSCCVTMQSYIKFIIPNWFCHEKPSIFDLFPQGFPRTYIARDTRSSNRWKLSSWRMGNRYHRHSPTSSSGGEAASPSRVFGSPVRFRSFGPVP